MKTIKKIMIVLMVITMVISMTACGGTDNSKLLSEEKDNAATFPKFHGKDFDGNDVDSSLFANNDVTVLNFWFNGCSACVDEMPQLETLNAKLKEKNSEIVGVNVLVGENKNLIDEAKNILSKQGATYRNIIIKGDQDALNYISKIFAFPTTFIIDKAGKIIGAPIVGSIKSDERIEQILKIVDDIRENKTVSNQIKSEDSSNDKVTSLLAEENNIFSEHKDVWDKLFANIQNSQVEQNKDIPYVEFLKSQIEKSKSSFTEEELNTLNDDLKRIDEIEAKIKDLNQ